MSKKTDCYNYVMLILGSTIGAGLASGQEIVLFFAQYGFVSLPFLLAFVFLFSFSILTLFKFGKISTKEKDFDKTIKHQVFFDSCGNAIFIIFSATMVSGIESLFNQLFFYTKFHLWAIISLFICAFIILKGFKFILKLNAFLVPIIIIATIGVCALSFSPSIKHSPLTFNTDISNFIFLITSTILYSSCNIMISNKVLIKVGTKIKKESAKKVAIISSIILALIIALIVIALLSNDNSLLFAELPLVYLAFTINSTVGYIYSGIIFLCIITTLLTTLFSFNENLRKKISNKFFSTFIACILIFSLSLFGFENIVRYSYPIIGAIGIFMIFSIKNRLNYENCSCPVLK